MSPIKETEIQFREKIDGDLPSMEWEIDPEIEGLPPLTLTVTVETPKRGSLSPEDREEIKEALFLAAHAPESEEEEAEYTGGYQISYVSPNDPLRVGRLTIVGQKKVEGKVSQARGLYPYPVFEFSRGGDLLVANFALGKREKEEDPFLIQSHSHFGPLRVRQRHNPELRTEIENQLRESALEEFPLGEFELPLEIEVKRWEGKIEVDLELNEDLIPFDTADVFGIVLPAAELAASSRILKTGQAKVQLPAQQGPRTKENRWDFTVRYLPFLPDFMTS